MLELYCDEYIVGKLYKQNSICVLFFSQQVLEAVNPTFQSQTLVSTLNTPPLRSGSAPSQLKLWSIDKSKKQARHLGRHIKVGI